MQPDGTSSQIQRQLYATLTASYDNNSPKSLPLYFVCYGIKNALQNDLDMTIYDYNKSCEIASETMKMHIPIDMNGFDILKTSHYLHGYIITNLSDQTFIINGSKRIQSIYSSFKPNYEKLNIQIYYGFQLAFNDFFISDLNTQKQTFIMNITLQNGHFKVKLLNNDVPNGELDILIKYIH